MNSLSLHGVSGHCSVAKLDELVAVGGRLLTGFQQGLGGCFGNWHYVCWSLHLVGWMEFLASFLSDSLSNPLCRVSSTPSNKHDI